MTPSRREHRETVAEMMTALSHPRRVAIFQALREAPEGMSFEDLLAATGLSVSTLTHHLRPMRAANLEVSQRRRQRVSLRIDGRAMSRLIGDIRSEISDANASLRPALRSV